MFNRHVEQPRDEISWLFTCHGLDLIALLFAEAASLSSNFGHQLIASQTKSITIVDRAAIDDQGLVFRKEGGGWPRLNKVFNEELGEVLKLFQREVWAA